MNKIIKKQLEQLNLPTDQLIIKIPKKEGIRLVEGGCYLIEISSLLLNSSPTSTWAINWNRGILPTASHYKVEVNQLMKDMVKVTGIAYDALSQQDLNRMWSGWLPLDQITILQKL